jgi:hypothetical protein
MICAAVNRQTGTAATLDKRILTLGVFWTIHINPLNAELNPICHLLALIEAHHILHVSMVRVKDV